MKRFLSGLLICWVCAVPNVLAADSTQDEWTGPDGALLNERFDLILKKLDILQETVNILAAKQKEFEEKMMEEHQQIRYWIHNR